MRYHGPGLLAALAAATIAGCHSSDSSNSAAETEPAPIAPAPNDVAEQQPWKTRDAQFNATISAADDASAKVSVHIWTDSPIRPIFHKLVPGDALSACVSTVCGPLTFDPMASTFGRSYYTGELPYVAETSYTVSLSRESEVSAPNSSVTLSVPFTILAPPAGLQVTDGQVITVQWAPLVQVRNIEIAPEARCDHPDGVQTDRGGFDIGQTTVSVDAILRRLPNPTPPDPRVLSCDIVIHVRAVRLGTSDTAFANGSTIFGTVTRSVTIHYTPSQR